MKNNLKCKTINEIKDTEGRIILINIEINENIFTLINVYAPNQHKNRNKFFKKVQNIIENNRLGILILGGDMNETLSINDKKTNNISRNYKPVNSLKKLIKKNNLTDIWRELHPNTSQFTWRRKNDTKIASRIDFFLISPDIRPHVMKADIRPAMISYTDHQAISLQVRQNSEERGRGFFKINNSILKEQKYIDLINKLIENYKKTNTHQKFENTVGYV